MPYFKAVILSVIFSLLGYGLWIGLSESEQIFSALSKLNFFDLFIILGLSVINYLMRFVRWQYYLNKLESPVPWFQSMLIYLAGFALTTTPGKAGEAIRSLYLKPYGVSYSGSLAAFTSERLSDVVSMALISILALYTFHEYSWLAVVLSLCTIALILSIQFSILHKIILRCSHGLKSEKPKRILNYILNILNVIRPLMGNRSLIIGAIIGLIAWGAEAFALSYLVHQLGFEANPFLVAGIYAISVMIGAAAFLPGGLGGTEAAMALLLISIGVTHESAMTATIICRLTTLWFAVAIGLVIMLAIEMIPNLIRKKVTQP